VRAAAGKWRRRESGVWSRELVIASYDDIPSSSYDPNSPSPSSRRQRQTLVADLDSRPSAPDCQLLAASSQLIPESQREAPPP
jgi:hypothetical protein